MYRLTVKGIVQGVGFRPFIYRLAKSMNLKGYVKNTGDGTVEIVIDKSLEEFLTRLKNEKPPISQIDDIKVEEIQKITYNDFVIEESSGRGEELSLPPPDVALCEKCLEEVFDVKNRRHMYPFISCTDCGARFTVAIRLPYDRYNTTFNDFLLCKECEKEYWNVEDRRYYAQSIACGVCGPNYEFVYDGGVIKGLDGIKVAAKFVDDNKIVAIKGLGGFHIACKTNDKVILRLRKLLNRPQQPFAVMVRDIDTLKRIAFVSGGEERELQSHVRPIVVLRKRENKEFEAVAPKLNTIGVMLPYTALHHILFHFMDADFVVMTSANLPGEPMYIDDGIFNMKLDGYLRHNLKIHNRCDDSVVKFVGKRRMIIRRSRGFVPKTIQINSNYTAIAFGAELYNSMGILKDKKAILSQYIGNTANFQTFNEFFKRAVEFFKNFVNLSKIDYVICDLHPFYNTTNFAERFSEKVNANLIKIQHHFAHALSVMAEKKLNKAVAITVDGVGYGLDGNIWGGEVLLVDFDKNVFQRIGRLEYIKLLGGDLAVNFPLRTLFSIVYGYKREYDCLSRYERYLNENESFELFAKQYERNLAVIKASSAGRVLDAVAALLEVCFERTYEGEPAMKLEAIAECSDKFPKSSSKPSSAYKPIIDEVREKAKYSMFGDEPKHGNVKVLRISPIVCDALEKYDDGECGKDKIALDVIEYLADGLSTIAINTAKKYDLPVVLSGGVAYNSIFTPRVEKNVKNAGVEFYTNELVAAGDNGICLGQLYLTILSNILNFK
ncbi:carbamoyltransferase HypF [Archaeoglobales archaeon]|nr:MAG: carbamoyltransferase HypF [Archaeoglobales archaeon]